MRSAINRVGVAIMEIIALSAALNVLNASKKTQLRLVQAQLDECYG